MFSGMNRSPRIDFPHLPFSVLVPTMFCSYLAFVCCCSVNPCVGLNWLGVVEAQNRLDKPSEDRNLTNRSRGHGYLSMHTLKSTGRGGMAQGTV